MKLLLDNNLSPKLVTLLASLYPESTHVSLIRLDKASDLDVWTRAKVGEYCLVTKDSDFNDLLATKGFPPKLIWIRRGNCTTGEIALLLQENYQQIIEFSQNPLLGLLELQ